MNIFTWVLQVLLAFWEIAGGIFLINNYRLVANAHALSTFPASLWTVLGVVQIVLALGLLAPGSKSSFRNIAPLSAAALALISLWGLELYTSYAGFPGVLWGLIPAALLAFVAYRRSARGRQS